MGWLSGYTYRRKLTVDSTEIDASLSDFPVLVKLDNSNFDYSKTKTDGTDIRFTSSDETTLLKYEREVYDFGFDSYTKLLLHCDGTDGSTSFPDATGKHTITAKDNAQVDTAQKKFGTASALLDGTADYLEIPDSPDWDLGTGDFTIDCWVRFADTATGTICARVSGNYFYWSREGSSGWRFRDFGGSIDFSRTFANSINTWYHMAIVRSGNDFKMYVDGTQIGTTYTSSATMIDRTAELDIGHMTENAGYALNGHIDEFRYSKGIARWTSNFTPPSSAYEEDTVQGEFHVKVPTVDNSTDTDIYMYYGNALATDGEDAVNVWDSNYLFVSHMKDITDSTIKNSKDGTSKSKLSSDNPLQSDGLNYKSQDFSTDSINLGDIDIDGDGTVEAIINPDSFPSTYGNTIVSKGDGGGSSSYSDLGLILTQTNGYINIQTGDTSTYQSFVSTLQAVADSWQYVAGRTDGSNLSAFLDTTKQTQAQTTTPAGNANNYRIGQFGDYTGLQFDGRIGEVRISSNARTDAWLKATRQTLFDNLLTFGSEQEQPSANIIETVTLNDDWVIQTNPEQASIDETVTLNDDWVIDTSPKQEAINETVNLDDAWTVLLQQKAYYATEIISANSLVFVTDTNPARILHIDITDPENPVIDGADLLSVTNAQSVTFDSNTDFLYVACANGKVVKVDINDLSIQTIIDLSDTDELVTIRNLNNYSLIYTSTDNAIGELYQIDERLTTKLITDFQYLLGYYVPISTDFNFIEIESLNTDFQYLSDVTTSLKTDFKWVASGVIDPIDRDDIIVTVNGTDLTAKDIRLDSIVIVHTVDDKSQATFTVARRHDNINQTMAGEASELTNNNAVVITINGHVEFTGKVSSLNCQYNKDSELIVVTALGTQPAVDVKQITLSLPLLDNDISLYNILIQNPTIYNPYIDPADEDPEIYKGIKVALGERREENLFRGRYIETTPAGQFQGQNAQKIDNGTFNFDNNSTYFWQVEALNYVNAVSWGTPTYKYIGTSLGSVSSDTWYLKGIAYWRQKQFDDIINDMGFYTVGSAPYQEISVKNGRFITKDKYADRPDGFYTVRDEGYNYVGNVQDYDHDGQYTTITKGYTQLVADLEYEKLQNINGDILPLTSVSMQITLDAYYYYAMKLLTRINIDNTTQANIYNNSNGFPVSIKTITIDTNTMSISLATDNTKSLTELEEIDSRYPNEENYIVDSYEALVTPKFKLPSSNATSQGASFNFLPSNFWDT